MKIISNIFTKDITSIIYISDHKILSGNINGNIALLALTEYHSIFNLQCEHNFSGHSNRRNYLKVIPNNRFVSISSDGTIRIWNLNYNICEKILKGGSVILSECDSILALHNDLIVVAGNCSLAWECFDVWDIKTEECIYHNNGLMHRAHGVSMSVVKGFIAVKEHCVGGLSIWKVDREQCTQLDICDDQRTYSMTVSKTGEIITGGFSLNVFTVFDDGKIKKYKTLENGNVIDNIIALEGYRVLTINRKNSCAGTLKI